MWGDSTPGFDVLEERVDDAEGEEVVHTRPVYKRVFDWMREHWIASLLLLVAVVGTLSAGWYYGWLREAVEAVPPWGWSAAYYLCAGVSVTALPAYWVIGKLRSPSGYELLDLDPVTNRHRHLRIGERAWQRLEVRSPWGEELPVDALQEVSVNGRSGYEVMDLRLTRDGRLTCVATWMGEADSAMLRTYARAVEYARTRLAKRAEKALAMEANREAIVREVAERVVVSMIRTAERSGSPHGEEIEGVVDDVLRDFGLGGGLGQELEDSRAADREELAKDGEAEDDPDLSDLADLAEESDLSVEVAGRQP